MRYKDKVMKVLSLNIRAWTRDRKKSGKHYWVDRYHKIHNYIKQENPDVICLQEVWWPTKYILKLETLGYKKTGWGFSHPIYVKKNMKVSKRRVSIFSTTAVVNDIQVFNIHCRWEEDLFQKAMDQITKWFLKFSKDNPAIAAGDFNRSDISSISNAICFSSLRERMGKSPVDTFANYKKPNESHGEIDHFFISWSLDAVGDYKIGPNDMSDHRPIVCEVERKYKN